MSRSDTFEPRGPGNLWDTRSETFKPRRPIDFPDYSSVFLYGFYSEQGQVATYAAVGSVAPADFQVVKTFAVNHFPFYVDVYGAARNGRSWLLFLDHRDGRAVTGLIDDSYQFIQAHTHPPGFLTGWRHVAVDGEGYLLLVKGAGEGRSSIALASVDDDGLVIVWWTSEIDLPTPDQLIGLPTAHLWVVVDEKGHTSTAHVLHRGQHASQTSWGDVWRGAASQGNLFSLYRAALQLPEKDGARPTVEPRTLVGSVGADHQITTLADVGDWTFPLRVDTGIDVTTPTGIVFVQRVLGAEPWAQVRSLSPAGYVPTFDFGYVPSPTPASRGQVHWKVAAC